MRLEAFIRNAETNIKTANFEKRKLDIGIFLGNHDGRKQYMQPNNKVAINITINFVHSENSFRKTDQRNRLKWAHIDIIIIILEW